MKRIISYWLDQRDIPDARWGKTKVHGCECTNAFTCRACLQRCVDRNKQDQNGQPMAVK